MADLRSRWPNADVRGGPGRAAAHGRRGLRHRRRGPVRLALIGAPFQLKVWEALLTHPLGPRDHLFGDRACHRPPKGVRAVGTAVGRNPVSWLIPCHRAVRKSGGLGGYHWGLPVKRAILARETAALEAAG
jgi:AraC family transcriptional regulator of adaptative response/methylated-DNA-[protein]-cysteine methyltransferase